MRLPSACLLKLKNLTAFWDRLTKTKVSLKQTLQDLKGTSKLVDNSFIIEQSEKQLKLIEQQIKYTARRTVSIQRGKKSCHQRNEALGKSKSGYSTEVHVSVDALGNPRRLILTVRTGPALIEVDATREKIQGQ